MTRTWAQHMLEEREVELARIMHVEADLGELEPRNCQVLQGVSKTTVGSGIGYTGTIDRYSP